MTGSHGRWRSASRLAWLLYVAVLALVGLATGLWLVVHRPVPGADAVATVSLLAQRMIHHRFPCPLLAAGWPPDRHRRPPRARAGPRPILLGS